MHASADRKTVALVGAVVMVAFVAPASLLAQNWIKVPTPPVPRTADGKPNLLAAAPRGPDGKPDLTNENNRDLDHLPGKSRAATR